MNSPGSPPAQCHRPFLERLLSPIVEKQDKEEAPQAPLSLPPALAQMQAIKKLFKELFQPIESCVDYKLTDRFTFCSIQKNTIQLTANPQDGSQAMLTYLERDASNASRLTCISIKAHSKEYCTVPIPSDMEPQSLC